MEAISEFWGFWVFVVSAVFGVSAWLVRLESRGISNGKEIKRLWEVRREDLDASIRSRQDMDDKLGVISADIKLLLMQSGVNK
jgi:hypothetical protein